MAQKKKTEWHTIPQYVDAITGISVWGNFSWEKWYQDDHKFWFSSLFSRAHFVRECWGQKLSLFSLTLKRLGGGGALKAPPRHFARLLCNAQSSRRDTLWLFSFKSPAQFDTNLWRPGVRFWSYVTFCTCTSDPKMAPKCDFVYKINANWVFSHSSYKYAYFYSQWLKWICFSIIVLQKVSATNFTEKNNKNKRSKKQRNT